MGSYPDPSNMMITQTHEHLLVFRKWVDDSYHQSRELPPVDSTRRVESKLTKERWRTLTTSNWEIEPVTQSQIDADHSAVYPEELPKRAVQLYSFKGDTVVDPFIGIGTTAVAAKKAGRQTSESMSTMTILTTLASASLMWSSTRTGILPEEMGDWPVE